MTTGPLSPEMLVYAYSTGVFPMAEHRKDASVTHYAIAKAALEAGFDVFCEKPLSMSLAEATELERIARRRRRVLAIPFTYSGFPMVKLARDLVARGELGKIDKVVLEYQQGSFRKIDFSKPLDKRNAWKMDPRKYLYPAVPQEPPSGGASLQGEAP